jgi:hypothetical protein
MPRTGRLLQFAIALLLLAQACIASGCVHRRLTIRTDPPGALAEVDGVSFGPTPVSTDFTYFGTREIKLSMPGYETKTVQQPISRPWYQVFPIEFFADNLVPFQVTNRHDFTYRLQPRDKGLDEENQLYDRAHGFRSQAEIGQ